MRARRVVCPGLLRGALAYDVNQTLGSPTLHHPRKWDDHGSATVSDRIEEMPVPLQQLLRDLVGAFRDEPSARDTSGSSPPAASPRAADVPPYSAKGAVTPDTGSRGDLHGAPTTWLDDLPLAQGHELLGPCRDCTGYWTRELTRGQKPLTCPLCKRLGPPD
jgi:hypothetical protein